jgi:hypothetical protein
MTVQNPIEIARVDCLRLLDLTLHLFSQSGRLNSYAVDGSGVS